MTPFLLRLMQRDKIPMKAILKPEEKDSVLLADKMRGFTLDGSYKGLWFHVPNEGKRHIFVALIMKAMGLLPGLSDFVFAGKWGIHFAELKIKPNKQSEFQGYFQKWVEHCGFEYQLAYSHEEVITRLKERGAFA